MRRAWVEIELDKLIDETEEVALHAEGVGRNDGTDDNELEQAMSPSMRRAWVEMVNLPYPVSLALCRPPCGGRG